MIPVREHVVDPGEIIEQLLKSLSFEPQSTGYEGGPYQIDFQIYVINKKTKTMQFYINFIFGLKYR